MNVRVRSLLDKAGKETIPGVMSETAFTQLSNPKQATPFGHRLCGLSGGVGRTDAGRTDVGRTDAGREAAGLEPLSGWEPLTLQQVRVAQFL